MKVWEFVKIAENDSASSESHQKVQEQFEQVSCDDSETVTIRELCKADMMWIRSAQELLSMEKDFMIQRRQFNLFKDKEGIWRFGGDCLMWKPLML